MVAEHAARPRRRAGGDRRRGTLPRLRRRLVHHGRGAARRRRTGDVSERTATNGNGQRRVVITGLGMVSPLGNDVRDVVVVAARGRVRRRRDHRVRPHRLQRPLRLRAEGLRPDGLDRPQGGAAHGPLRADDPRRRAPGRGRLGRRGRRRRRTASARRSRPASAVCRATRSATTCSSTRGPDRVSPFSIPSIIPNMGAGWVSIELGTKGPLMSECTACAASNMAIGDAMDEIRIGRADVMFAGGTEAPITQVGIAGFDAMRALSRRNDDPARASRPFDNERDGLVMGEAAAVLVLEELEHAQARGAKIYAELLGYGISSDASHMTEPDPTGENPARAITMALADARRRPDRGRLRERARDVDAARRLRRDARDQARVRRGAREDEARGLVDEGRDRPLLRRRRRGRGGLHGAWRSSTARRRRRSTTRTRTRTAISTTCRTCARDLPDLSVAVSNSFGFGGHNASIVVRRWDEIAAPAEAVLRQDPVVHRANNTAHERSCHERCRPRRRLPCSHAPCRGRRPLGRAAHTPVDARPRPPHRRALRASAGARRPAARDRGGDRRCDRRRTSRWLETQLAKAAAAESRPRPADA